MKLLVVSEWFPAPPVAGAKIRAYSLVRQLARLAEIDLVAQVNMLTADQVAAGTALLSQFCNTVQCVSAIPYRYSIGKALRTLVDPVPPAVRYKRNLALEHILMERLATRYDAVVATISGFPSSTLRSLATLGARPLIADSLELGVLRPKSETPASRRVRNEFTWWHLRRFTRRLLKDVDVVTVTSETERELFADLVHAPDQCIVVPNVLDLRDYEGEYGPRDYHSLLYAGSFGYGANYEAMMLVHPASVRTYRGARELKGARHRQHCRTATSRRYARLARRSSSPVSSTTSDPISRRAAFASCRSFPADRPG